MCPPENDFGQSKPIGRTAAIFKIVNCSLINTVTISLSHLLRDHWPDFLKIVRVFNCLVVSAQKQFRPVDKYDRREPSLINRFIALSLDLLELYCQEFVYTILFRTKIFEWPHKGVNIYIYLFITSTDFSKSQFIVFIMLSFTC